MWSIAERFSNARRTSAGLVTPWRAIASIADLVVRYSMKEGITFIANSAMTMNSTSMMSSPMMVTPRCCFLMIVSLSPCAVLSAEAPETPQLVEIEPDEERLADDVFVGDESPYAAVARVVPVVPHHEVVPRRNRARQAAAIVVAISGVRERTPRHHPRRRVLVEQYFMFRAI